ncbi:MAG: hypothetical protein HC769_19905 [Cyanobacteria bacterium CRU_2_1]|nr:hypothetical protein [Cyanobacteria bacterium CRU_2_1]
MKRILLATLRSAMSCQLHRGLGRASVLFAFEGTYRFDGGKSVSEGILQQLPDGSIRINSSAAGGAGQS